MTARRSRTTHYPKRFPSHRAMRTIRAVVDYSKTKRTTKTTNLFLAEQSDEIKGLVAGIRASVEETQTKTARLRTILEIAHDAAQAQIRMLKTEMETRQSELRPTAQVQAKLDRAINHAAALYSALVLVQTSESLVQGSRINANISEVLKRLSPPV